MEVCGRDGDGEGEGGDLAEGVNASVGAARALGKDGFACDTVDCLGECALNGRQVGLNLPAVVGCSVVGEGGLPVRHGADLDGITVGWVGTIAGELWAG